MNKEEQAFMVEAAVGAAIALHLQQGSIGFGTIRPDPFPLCNIQIWRTEGNIRVG